MSRRLITAREVVEGMRVLVKKHVEANGPLLAHSLTYEGLVHSKDPAVDEGWYWDNGYGNEGSWIRFAPDQPVYVLDETETAP